MSATLQQAHKEVCDAVRVQWAAAGEDADKLLWVGVEAALPAASETWARANPQFASGRETAIGGRLFERAGVLLLEVYVPGGHGDKILLTLCETMTDAFEGVETPSGVRFRNARVTGTQDDAEWRRALIAVDFQADRIR